MKFIILIGGLLLNSFLGNAQEFPQNWEKGGSWAGNFKMEFEKSELKEGKQSIKLYSKPEEIYGSGTVEQRFSGINYRGKKLKLTAWVKTSDVKYWTSLFIGFDQENAENSFSTEGSNIMKLEKIRGYHDWIQISTERDVPWNTEIIKIGLVLFGKGCVWADGMELTAIDAFIPKPIGLNDSPLNLGFEESILIGQNEIYGYTKNDSEVVFSFNPNQYINLSGNGMWSNDLNSIKIKSVCLASELNSWNPKDKNYLMKKNGNIWEIKIPYKLLGTEKTIEFKFVINGKFWVEPQKYMKNTVQAGNWEGSKNFVFYKN